MATPDERAAVLDDLAWRRMIADHTDLDALRAAMAAGPVTLLRRLRPDRAEPPLRQPRAARHDAPAPAGGSPADRAGRRRDRPGRRSERAHGGAHAERARGGRGLGGAHPVPGRALPAISRATTPRSIVNNLDWTGEMSAIDWLRDIGKHFSVSRMLAKESVSARLEAGGISYTEFSYQVMQALDFLELYRRHGCTLQLGGSDQWGNLTAGVDLIRRVEGASVHALATPLITRPDGEKFGKSTGSTLWLDPALTSPFAFYQWFVNTDDSVVGHATCASSASARATRSRSSRRSAAARPDAREAQRALARGAHRARARGRCGRARRRGQSEALFGDGDLAALDAGDARGRLRRPAAHRGRRRQRHPVGARPAGRVGALGEPRPGATRRRRGRRLRQQPARVGSRGGAGPSRAARRPLAAAAARQAQPRRGRGRSDEARIR